MKRLTQAKRKFEKKAILEGACLPAIFIGACLLIQFFVGAFATDRGQTADEAAHFVTSMMVSDYVRHLDQNPIAFAKTYYAHLPKIGMGHWPPLFEVLQSFAFDLFGGTNAVAMVFQAVIGGLLAGLPAALVSRHFGYVLGAITGLIILCSPNIMFLVSTDMADNLLGLLVFLSTYAWSEFYRKRSARWAIILAIAMSAAILTKGSAYGLLLLPILYVCVKRDWLFLFDRKTIFSFGAVLIVTVPWYVATYRLAASGWVYSWGWTYSSAALVTFAKSFLSDFGLPCTIGFLAAAVFLVRSPDTGPIDIAAFALSALAMFVFISLVPADIAARYLIPTYVSGSIVAVWGIMRLLRSIVPALTLHPIALQAVTAMLVLLSIWQGFQLPHVESFHTQKIVDRILNSKTKNPLILVSGSSRFEGALIASLAQTDRDHVFYALRSTSLLASSNFMGSSYELRFTSESAMRDWLVQNKIGWIIVDRSPESLAFSHERMLLSVLASNSGTFHTVWRDVRADGDVLIVETPSSALAPNPRDKIFGKLLPSGLP
jgi:Dolichyl-phosphate-mannose-protein mannosyltransferase